MIQLHQKQYDYRTFYRRKISCGCRYRMENERITGIPVREIRAVQQRISHGNQEMKHNSPQNIGKEMAAVLPHSVA